MREIRTYGSAGGRRGFPRPYPNPELLQFFCFAFGPGLPGKTDLPVRFSQDSKNSFEPNTIGDGSLRPYLAHLTRIQKLLDQKIRIMFSRG